MRTTTRHGKTPLIVLLSVFGVLFLLCAGLVALIVVPAVGQAQEAARRQMSMTKMKEMESPYTTTTTLSAAFPQASCRKKMARRARAGVII